MFYRILLVLILGLSGAWPQTTIPDGPAGQTFKAWLEAFNSGDPAQIEAYCHKYDPKQSADAMKSFRNMTGGFELLQILKGERLHLEFLVKERNSDTKALGSLDVKDAEPAEVIQCGHGRSGANTMQSPTATPSRPNLPTIFKKSATTSTCVLTTAR